MTAIYILNKLIAAGEQLRTRQKDYYAMKYSDQKKEALAAAKKSEKEFDLLITQVKTLMENKTIE